MSIVIKRIERTADGREIVRSETVTATAFRIGRAAENTIHLPDLAVNPDHAGVVADDGRHIEVTATGGLGFELDGRTVLRAKIDSMRGAELGFGGHRITVSRADDAIILSVERVEALSETGEINPARAFTLRGLVPGKRGSAWAFALAVLVAFLALPIWSYATNRGVEARPAGFHADASWSSGALSQSHTGLKKDCQSCHVEPFVAVRDTACKGCHEDTHDHAGKARMAAAVAPRELGGRILAGFSEAFNKPQGGCVDCHSEHEGAGPMQPTAQKFCSDCHARLDTRLTDTKLGNAGDFGSQHPQFAPLIQTRIGGAAPRFQRVSMDKPLREDSGLKFPHKLHLSTTNGVAQMTRRLKSENGFGDALACKDCHTPTADGVRFLPVDMEQDCAMCHSLAFETIGGTVRTLRHGDPAQVVADLRAFYRSSASPRPIQLGGMARRRPGSDPQGQPHRAYFGATGMPGGGGSEAAIRAVFSRGGACYDCHVVIPPAAGQGWQIAKVEQTLQYMNHGWFDHDAHKSVKAPAGKNACATCHKADASGSANDVLLPGIATCRTCHGGEASAAAVPSGCAMCHDYHRDTGAPSATRPKGLQDQRIAQLVGGVRRTN